MNEKKGYRPMQIGSITLLWCIAHILRHIWSVKSIDTVLPKYDCMALVSGI